jgi:transposase InsO family protein
MGNTVPLSGEVWMPWKECSVVDERLRFVAQLLDGEAMSEVCRAFGISRKTGYKIFERYKEHGLEALTDRSRRYCFPLTVTDHASRFLLLCEALESTRENLAITAFEQLFQERGLPQAIRSDNGVPFASPNGLFNLSKLSVWWLRLGIAIERIKPGHPQQNGRHERMHLTLKKEATRPPGMNSLQQQARFDDFVQEFNTERPHEALAMKCPAEIYSASSRPYSGLPDLTYPLHDRDALVTACGRICMHRKRLNISTVLAGQRLGIKEVDDGIWIVSFMHYDLGFIDLEQKTLQPLDNPFGTGLSPMS